MRLRLLLLTITAAISALTATAGSTSHTFTAGDKTFLYDGEPFVVKAAELHYPRIPRPYWEHRILMCKALGMNTICLYVFWNIHEQQPGSFDFTGQNDLREFILLCQANDMKVILRPGPYVCAEWEMGGLPWWLLRYDNIRLRENDHRFIDSVKRFEQAVASQVGDLTVDKGGPIIMIQVENEYGSYGTDKVYVATIRDTLRSLYGDSVLMFQCDWSSNFLNNGLDNLLWTINFGTGSDIDEQFAPLRQARPDSPLMCSEYWSGWFDKWGANHETRPADDMIAGIDEMLSKGISFSLYMTHGGTNWGHWAGANSPGFAPDVTSYDYDAPINESGQPTDKYHKLRRLLSRHNGGNPLPDIPQPIASATVDTVRFCLVAPLSDNMPVAISDSTLHSIEHYGMGYGSVAYTTTLPDDIAAGTILTVDEPHDYAQIFIDGHYTGHLDRRLGEKTLTLPAVNKGSRIDILIEAMGRINFGRAISDRKGIVGNVSLTSTDGVTTDLTDRAWKVTLLPDSIGFYRSMSFRDIDTVSDRQDGRLPRGVYRATFSLERPADTFLNFESWGKGLVYVNGHALGRFWEIGPQQTLYTPGCWLNAGENEIIVFDIVGPHDAVTYGLSTPVLDRVNQSVMSSTATSTVPDIGAMTHVATSTFDSPSGWQQVTFDSSISARWLCLKALEAFDGDTCASIAELYALTPDGTRLPREQWRVVYTDGNDTTDGNHTPDKIIDLQESTHWASAPGTPMPHTIIIDLGGTCDIAGLQYLPPVVTGTPGAIKKLEIYTR